MASFTENSSTVRVSNEPKHQFAPPPNTYQPSMIQQGSVSTQYIRQPVPTAPYTSNLKPNQPSPTSINIAPPNPSLEFTRPSTVLPAPAAHHQHLGLPPTHPLPQKSSIHSIPIYSPINTPSTPPFPWNHPIYPMQYQFPPAPQSIPSRIRSPSPTPSEDSKLTFVNESQTDSEYGRNSLIDPATPESVIKLILDTIGVRPYDLENDIRSPELFIDQFETYAELLELNETQKRVLFAGLAYNDDESCFEAIKFDTTYHDMRRNFPIVMRNLELRRMNSMRIEAGARKSSFVKRTRKFFRKWFK